MHLTHSMDIDDGIRDLLHLKGRMNAMRAMQNNKLLDVQYPIYRYQHSFG
jgi:hypothetical protein